MMIQASKNAEHIYHIQRPDWLTTPTQEPRGYIQPKTLSELWFHTGTICNLSCPFCLEGSRPGDDRLNKLNLDDVTPYMQEAVRLGVQKFSFTGGEPFVIKDMIKILDYALDLKDCFVLTNGTNPLRLRIDDLKLFLDKPHNLQFRVSIDYPDEQKHDEGRGSGNYALGWQTIKELNDLGFLVSIARQRTDREDTAQVQKQYQKLFKRWKISTDIPIISFPNFLTPGSMREVPHITDHCMKTYHDEQGRDSFMCNYSKMIVKRDGKMRIVACTLVDDDLDYELGSSLTEAMKIRIMLKHHRCYSCFAQGASCS